MAIDVTTLTYPELVALAGDVGQPTGAHDAYALGAQVTHNGFVWTSLVDANVWEPTDANATLWEKGEAV